MSLSLSLVPLIFAPVVSRSVANPPPFLPSHAEVLLHVGCVLKAREEAKAMVCVCVCV